MAPIPAITNLRAPPLYTASDLAFLLHLFSFYLPKGHMAATAVEGAAVAALRSVMHRVRRAADRSGHLPDRVRVVAVSKTKPVSLIRQVNDTGHRCFGENYVQEILEKAPQLPEDRVAFHWALIHPSVSAFLDIFYVDLAACQAKSGIDPSGCVDFVKHVKLHCPNLEFSGLMTIGMLDYSSTPENFKTLSNCRMEVCKALGMEEQQCELSMGMSGDFEFAIEMGSSNVRVGSTIFGPREFTKKQQN